MPSGMACFVSPELEEPPVHELVDRAKFNSNRPPSALSALCPGVSHLILVIACLQGYPDL